MPEVFGINENKLLHQRKLEAIFGRFFLIFGLEVWRHLKHYAQPVAVNMVPNIIPLRWKKTAQNHPVLHIRLSLVKPYLKILQKITRVQSSLLIKYTRKEISHLKTKMLE